MTRRSPVYVAVAVGMASYVDAAAITGFGVSLAILRPLLGLDAGQVGLAAGGLAFGIAAGALIGGRLGDRVGRRPVFVATMVIIAASALVLMVPPQPPVLAVAALLLGTAIGADLPVSFAAVAEAAPDRVRGRMLLVSNLLWVAGIVVNFLIAGAVGELGAAGVRIIFGHVAIAAVVVLIGRLTIGESGRWTAARHELDEGVPTVRATRSRLVELVRPPYARPFAALIGFYALTNVVANTNGQFGVYVLSTYGGASVSQASLIVLAGVPIVLAGLLVFMRVVDGPRRFRVFVIGGCVGVLAPLTLAVFGVSASTYAISAVLGGVGIAFAFEGIMKIWTQESFPALLRSSAQGAVIAGARFTAAAFAAITPILLEADIAAFYWILTACQALGIAVAVVVFRVHARGDAFERETEIADRSS